MNLIIFENVTLVSEHALLYLVLIWVFTNFRCVIVMLVIFLLGNVTGGRIVLFLVLVFIVQDRVSSPAVRHQKRRFSRGDQESFV